MTGKSTSYIHFRIYQVKKGQVSVCTTSYDKCAQIYHLSVLNYKDLHTQISTEMPLPESYLAVTWTFDCDTHRNF